MKNRQERATTSPREFSGSISEIRATEDAIRATHKYTEGIESMGRNHPIQQDGHPSKTFTKCYEVYPDVVVGWDMSAKQAIKWLWADTTCINIRFWYDYRNDKATFKIIGGDEAMRQLLQSIPGMLQLLTHTDTGAQEARTLTELSKTMTPIPDPLDMDDSEMEEEEPGVKKVSLLSRLLPATKKK